MSPLALGLVGSIFSSAFLLFLVQPLVTRMLLPTYGGSPAVWNTALVFFQTALLAGYLYAHLLSTRVPVRARAVLHGIVLLGPLLLLPPMLPTDLWQSGGTEAWPALTLIGALGLMVGAPFFALSTNASLVQHWWSESGLPGSRDPYWLYGASNLGSLLALLLYPFVLEPWLGVARQGTIWSFAYSLFAVGTVVVMARVLSRRRRSTDSSATRVTGVEPAPDEPRARPARKALWVLRAAVGSSLLLSVTMQITTDLAPVPLLWVVPLALYLVTFIVAFGVTDRLPRTFAAGGVVVALSAALGVLLIPARLPFEVLLGGSLATLFFGALMCHHDLAIDRPGPAGLTSFYLWISVGGALGGILNSLVAPWLFDSVAELPLTLMALALLVYVEPRSPSRLQAYRAPWPVGALAAVAVLVPLLAAAGTAGGRSAQLIALAVAFGGVWTLALSRYVGLFGLSVWLAGALTLSGVVSRAGTVEQARSFFGVVTIRADSAGVDMIHGTTLHGRQLTDPALHLVPISYYHPAGPLGSVTGQVRPGGRIGMVGLGSGSLAILADSSQEVVYYEIDPLVERLARTHFTFLEESPARVRVVIGDGRLSLRDEPDGSFDLLLLDAFSSDFVPVHLLTVEAVDLFMTKVAPGGVLAFHVSNRHADLRRVLLGYAEERGLDVAFADYSPPGEYEAIGAWRSVAAVLSPDARVVARLAGSPLWSRYAADVTPVVWTDDHADLLSVLR